MSSELVGQLGKNVGKFVQMNVAELDDEFVDFTGANALWYKVPEPVVRRDVNGFPVIAKLREANVFRRLLIALLAVTTDAHGLVVPVSVWALLAFRNDVVSVHQNQVALGRLTEKINMVAAAFVLPGDQSVADSTTPSALAPVNGEGLEASDTETIYLANLRAHQALAE